MNHDLLQEKVLLKVPYEMIKEMYEEEQGNDIDEMLWKPIDAFAQECEELYITDTLHYGSPGTNG